MKKSIIISVCLILAGVMIAVSAMAVLKFDFRSLATEHPAEKAYEVDGTFKNISISAASCSVRIAPSENGKCSVVCNSSEKSDCSVDTSNDTLTVKYSESRKKWYEYVNFSWESTELTVYLPESKYGSLSVDVSSGNVDIDGICFDSVNMTGASSNASLRNVKCENADIVTSSGNVILTDTVLSGHLSIKSSSGNVKLSRSDAQSLDIDTSSGNVGGQLLSGKRFNAKSSSGNIRVPKSNSGGICNIKTSSGNINITVVSD